jgi:rRNA biogenesis protein RRP5
MAYFVSLMEIEKARSMADRALKAIDLREEKEKVNVWVAWMNLENLYGTPESLQGVFTKAVTFNEPKIIYLKLVEIYERANNIEKAQETYNVMIKKFRTSAKIWKQYAAFLVKNQKLEEFRQAMTKATNALPKKKRKKLSEVLILFLDLLVLTKFGQLEYNHGSAERGRTIFEGILSNYPKRSDIWNVYIDMETHEPIQSVPHVRNIFDRVITLNLSSKKMKNFFKRYLQFEKQYGTEKTVAHVKQKAQEYVEAKMD